MFNAVGFCEIFLSLKWNIFLTAALSHHLALPNFLAVKSLNQLIPI